MSLKRRTANEGPVRIKYKCRVPIYVFPDGQNPLVTVFMHKKGINERKSRVHLDFLELQLPVFTLRPVDRITFALGKEIASFSALQVRNVD